MIKLTQELALQYKQLREEDGLSRRAACAEIGVAESTMRGWERSGSYAELLEGVVDELSTHHIPSCKTILTKIAPVKDTLKHPLHRTNSILTSLSSFKVKGGIDKLVEETTSITSHSRLDIKKQEKIEIHSKDKGEDNSCILLISDLHVPYHHPDALAFLRHLKEKYNPTRIIGLGDELDKHSLSFHDNDPDLPNAGDELSQSLPVIKELFEMFPKMDLLESNHGSMVYRKANHHGIPRSYIKSYNEVLGVDDGWKWWHDMTITLPNGNKCYLHHGKSANITKTSQTMGMCSVAGHYHETFKVEYWANPNGLYWAMQSACLIDDSVYAFNYNNCNLKRPIIGTSLIVNSLPVLEPMVLNEDGRWVGY